MTYDWKKIKQAFLAGEHPTLEATANSFGIRPSYMRQRAAKEGWREERAEVERKISEVAKAAVIESEAAKIADAKQRHFRISQMLQGKAMQRICKVNETTGKDEHRFAKDETALQALRLGVNLERQALGMGREEEDDQPHQAPHTVNIHLTQVQAVLGEAGGAREAFLGALEQALKAGAAPAPRPRTIS